MLFGVVLKPYTSLILKAYAIKKYNPVKWNMDSVAVN